MSIRKLLTFCGEIQEGASGALSFLLTTLTFPSTVHVFTVHAQCHPLTYVDGDHIDSDVHSLPQSWNSFSAQTQAKQPVLVEFLWRHVLQRWTTNIHNVERLYEKKMLRYWKYVLSSIKHDFECDWLILAIATPSVVGGCAHLCNHFISGVYLTCFLHFSYTVSRIYYRKSSENVLSHTSDLSRGVQTFYTPRSEWGNKRKKCKVFENQKNCNCKTYRT